MSHVKHDCPGKWVNISTITSPSREKCTVCKAVRKIELSVDEILRLESDDDYEESEPIKAANALIPTWVLVGLVAMNALMIALITYDVFFRH